MAELNNEVDTYTQIQTFLDNIKTLHEQEINWYNEELRYLQRISNEQTMEIQKLNNLLLEYEDEIRSLKGNQEM